ncbi:cell division protein ZapB [Streptomyces sp. NPDC086554]|uniref:cell division protein ZapB n=1 Tax=Streptomyces sp. NPDC086554 TaxID=3154864 RepID=UPI0034197149
MTDLVGTAEIVGGAAVFLLFVYRQVKTGTRDAWREAAESQASHAEALEKRVGSLVESVEALRLENTALRNEVAELRSENRELREHIDRLIGGDGA